MRGQSIAISGFFGFMIGMGLGPFAAGALSDLFHPWAADQSLRFALLALCPGYLWAAWHMWAASKTIAQDLEAAQAQIQSEPSSPNQALGSLVA
jgi:MFS family permease